MSAAVDSIRIDLPAVWQQLPTDPGVLRKQLREARDEQQWGDLTPTERRRAELFLERFVCDVDQSGASLLSLYSERFEAEGDDPAGHLCATCGISVLDKAALGTNAPLNADVVLAAMSLEPAIDDASATTTTNLEPASTVELAAGPAVRVVRLVEQRLSVAEQLRVFTETFFIPVPDDFAQLVVAQFSTLNVEDSRLFSELFGSLANTIRFYREGEPTEL